MTTEPVPISRTLDRISALQENVERVIRGKGEVVQFCIAALLAKGHILLEDVPGVGKTTLAHALARSLSLSFQRIQFTSDLLPADIVGVTIYNQDLQEFQFVSGPVFTNVLLEDVPGVGKTTLAQALARSLGLSFQRIQFSSDLLPSDIIGVTIYNQKNQNFEFVPGPLFANVVLADEINRATPKTQSALLEAMSERKVSVERKRFSLPEPFVVLATQNPLEYQGTFPLPESQLDRFMMRIELGYPDRNAERALLSGTDRRDMLATLDPCMSPAELMELQGYVQRIHVSPALLDYVQAIVEHTRRSPDYVAGLSPRAALALVHSARAWALLEGRDKVIPEDVQAIMPGVAAHRLRPAHDSSRRVDVGAQLLAAVPIP